MNKKILTVVVLDESGSMDAIRDKTISCLNEYVKSLQPQGKMCHLTLVKFNSNSISHICDDIPVKDVPTITEGNYHPNGSTPLLDAVGKTIATTRESVSQSKVNPDVLFIVLTDGLENCSHQYSRSQIVDLITEREKAGWTFVYLGANQDSWQSASQMGYGSVHNVADFAATPDGVKHAMERTIRATSHYLSDRHAFYTRAASQGMNTATLSYQAKVFYQPDNHIGATNKKTGGKRHGRFQS